MRPFLPRLVAAALAVVASACSSRPDILASQDEVSPYIDAGFVPACRAGYYSGILYTGAPRADSGPPFDFSGTMNFRLVASKTGEFLELQDNAQLGGVSDKPVQGAKIAATIRSQGPCQEGRITNTFENGSYTVPGGSAFPFEGTSYGSYDARLDAFAGFWDVTVNVWGQLINLHGVWSAIREDLADGG